MADFIEEIRCALAMREAGYDALLGHEATAELLGRHDALVKALTDTLCELTACAHQLAARGLKGHEGDSVSRAQAAARELLVRVGGPGNG